MVMLMCGVYLTSKSDCCTHAHSRFREAVTTCDEKCVKRTVHPIIKKTYFWRDLISSRDVCLLSSTTELDVTHPVLLKGKTKKCNNSVSFQKS